MPQKPYLSPVIVLVAGVFAISTSAVLVRLAQGEAPSLVIAAGRLGFATVLLLPPALLHRRHELRRLPPAGWRLALLSGFMLGLHFAGYISALAYTSIAAATVLATTTPVWVGLAAPLFLGERATRALLLGLALAAAGGLAIALDGAAVGGGGRPLLGNGLALGAAWAAAVYLLIGRRLRPGLSLLGYTTVVYGMAALTLLALTRLAGQRLLGYSAQTYLLIFLMALLPQLVGHSSYNYALAFLPAAYVALAVISEPVGATLLGWLLLGEIPGALTVAGGLLVLAGIALASRRETV